MTFVKAKSDQKLIAGGKLLSDDQKISSLSLGPSNIIHLVISEQRKESAPVAAPRPELVPPPSVQEIAEPTEEINEDNLQSENESPDNQTGENTQAGNSNDEAENKEENAAGSETEEDWLSPELKRYFDVWDLSIRCYELNGSYDHLVPQLKLYRSTRFLFQRESKKDPFRSNI